ncbi:MAG: hypothetical protein AUJ01_14975 [Acidobacteria bacterium 13_1_40CM_3_65_5]|nr:MAG: hypothetical protein AUJ01_14975 [Acidobacteria bacterium 13_1_40CM_3_65_5]
MIARLKGSRFSVLFQEFVAQFFISESVTSDHQLRTAAIGVMAFLVTPGFLHSMQLSIPFEFFWFRFPELLEPFIRLNATLFITYGIVAMGVIAAFTWDALGFDRRDAMVLGPLPVSGAIVISAKLAALGALLLSGAAAVNVMTAFPFAMVASNHTGAIAALRHFTGHMIATMCAATFVFCGLVTIRALVGMIGDRREAITSLVQFVLVSAVLCFFVLAPTALRVTHGRRGAARAYMVQIPAWSPTNWFLGLYETIRGSSGPELWSSALVAIGVTLGSLTLAILATIAGYRRQLQLALAPSASAASQGAAPMRRALARVIVGRDRIARATADFIIQTFARNRPQQAPVAMNTAVGLAIVVAGLSRSASDLSALMRPRTAVLWIPLLLAYWATIGLRASFFVPSELPASWTFQSNAPLRSRAYWSAVRASLIAIIVPPAATLALALGFAVGWRVAAWHALIVTSVLVLFLEVIALTIDYIPFTRPYPPGHAKLKLLWPLYLFGMFAVAFWPTRYELRILDDPAALRQMTAWIGVAIAVLEVVGRWRALKWSVTWDEEVPDGLSSVTVLSIGNPLHNAAGN